MLRTSIPTGFFIVTGGLEHVRIMAARQKRGKQTDRSVAALQRRQAEAERPSVCTTVRIGRKSGLRPRLGHTLRFTQAVGVTGDDPAMQNTEEIWRLVDAQEGRL